MMKILVAEDSVTMRKVMEMTFAGEDAEVLAVASVDDALAQADSFQPDLVFADASMDGQDGYDLAQAIKGSSGLANVPVILMASQFHPYDESRGAECGVDDHISKPFDSKVVIKKAIELAGASAKAAPAEAAVSEAAPPSIPAPESVPAAASEAPPLPSAPAAAPSAAPVSVQVPAAAATNGNALEDMAARLGDLGLTTEQAEGVLKLSAEVIERVVWEVVPDLAETMIREEIRRLTT